ncbi:MAG: polyketide synthase dehydratase domain-containing protein, partial [Stackebrandtia sp.]
ALQAGAEVGCGRLEALALRAPLELTPRDRVRLQVSVGPPADGCRPVSVHSRPEGSPEWLLHAEGTVAPPRPPDAEAHAFGLGQWPPEKAEAVDVEEFYATIAEWGYGYGPSYRGITAAWRSGNEVFADIRLGDDHCSAAAYFGIHPGLFDAALHGFLVERMNRGDTDLALPSAFTGVELFTPGATAVRVRLTCHQDD